MGFSRFANHASHIAGTPWIFGIAVISILAWAIAGPFFGFSETWQLTVNTGTTIITFLMVFLIQNTQSRDAVAVQLKLDELIRSHQAAHNWLLDLEKLSESDLERLRKTFAGLAEKAREGGTVIEELQRDEKSGDRS
jgi:low affinity Fe/Cu permease